jgi:hypothetical protein
MPVGGWLPPTSANTGQMWGTRHPAPGFVAGKETRGAIRRVAFGDMLRPGSSLRSE